MRREGSSRGRGGREPSQRRREGSSRGRGGREPSQRGVLEEVQ